MSVYDIVATKSIKYRNITLVVGTNDCSKQDTPETIITNFDKLLAESKNKATGSITVSGICPRTDNEVYQSKVESVNAALLELCTTSEVNFINNDPTFRLQDNSINDGYLA